MTFLPLKFVSLQKNLCGTYILPQIGKVVCNIVQIESQRIICSSPCSGVFLSRVIGCRVIEIVQIVFSINKALHIVFAHTNLWHMKFVTWFMFPYFTKMNHHLQRINNGTVNKLLLQGQIITQLLTDHYSIVWLQWTMDFPTFDIITTLRLGIRNYNCFCEYFYTNSMLQTVYCDVDSMTIRIWVILAMECCFGNTTWSTLK